jgi:hypothetical protein
MGKRGPAPKGEYSNKSKVFSTRLREDTKEALVKSAKLRNISLSQEVEYRLRRSFDKDLQISEIFGSRKNYALLRLISCLIEMIPGDATSWVDDPANFDHVVASINLVLKAIRPPGADAESVAGRDQHIGRLNVAALANDLGAADASMPPGEASDLPFIKADLGPELSGRLKALEGETGLGSGQRLGRDAGSDRRVVRVEDMRKPRRTK